MTEAPEPNFAHLVHMTGTQGTYEHALFTEPRPEHGFCTDDMARVKYYAVSRVEIASRRRT